MAKYNVVAHLLWLVGGPLGAHHFYLGRDNQGLLWLTSFGGMFGFGWVRDFTRLRAYVKEANGSPEFLANFGSLMKKRRRPSVWTNLFRVMGQVAFGWFYRGLILYALPEEYGENSYLVLLLAPLGSAFGTYMTSNIGIIKCDWRYSLAGAYIGELLFGHHHWLLDETSPSLAVSVSMLFSTFAWEYDKRPRGVRVRGCCRRGACCRRAALWTLVLVVYGGLLASALYFNATITTPEGESVKVREAVNNFFKSPTWGRLKKSFWLFWQEIWAEFREKGWEAALDRLLILADVQGEERARRVLGVPANATLQEVKSRYRSLSKEWHPDKHQADSPEEKNRAQMKFMEIKEAHEILTQIYKRRESGKRYSTRG